MGPGRKPRIPVFSQRGSNVVAVQDCLCQAPIPCDVVNITLSVLNVLYFDILTDLPLLLWIPGSWIVHLFMYRLMYFVGGLCSLISVSPQKTVKYRFSSRKHLRIKVTPDFHLTYSKNGGIPGSE